MKEKQIRLPVEKKYSRDWHKYNLAKTNEKRMFVELLNDLTKIIKEPEYKFGRPPIPIRDFIFCTGLKLYSNYSGRKAVSDYRTSMEAGYVSRTPHFNTIKDFLNCPATYDLLSKLLTISAMPLKKLEDKYSLDSSGFGTYTSERWNRVKWGKNVKWKDYLKGHILIGTRTNIICEAEITPGTFSDVRQAPKMILQANANFKMKELSADKAYNSKLVFRILNAISTVPYIPFKHSTKAPDPNNPEIWNNMFLLFRDKKEEWGQHYFKRENVETTFAMVKRRLGEHLLSKNYTAQRNELLMKFICHNICCLIQAIFDHKIRVNFHLCSKMYVERKVSGNLITRDASKVDYSTY
ncbi:MAG TPA: IS4/IS5 family transposase [Candidatus Pacearchaeota archaeon]|nr:IS4/IS5 family transposase [Candidatus Pacearchaeota archaeon]